jgi:hypothetical protein
MIEVRATCSPEEIEPAVGEDLRAFETWFQGLGNDPLVRSEVAILKTYLYWKLRGEHAKTSR